MAGGCFLRPAVFWEPGYLFRRPAGRREKKFPVLDTIGYFCGCTTFYKLSLPTILEYHGRICQKQAILENSNFRISSITNLFTLRPSTTCNELLRLQYNTFFSSAPTCMISNASAATLRLFRRFHHFT